MYPIATQTGTRSAPNKPLERPQIVPQVPGCGRPDACQTPGQAPGRTESGMGTVYLVRHGQASLGADDYDQLSELGERQSERLGRYWAERGQRFDAVITGSLRRHAQTWAGIAAGAGLEMTPRVWPGLNEYDAEAVIRAVHTAALEKPDTPERYRQHFRLLREALLRWTAGEIQPEGMPAWHDFAAGVVAALDHVRETHQGAVLLVSSGGPIATAVQQVLGAPAATMVELNLRIRNSALSEFHFTPRRHALVTFNTLPHLGGEAYAGWISHT